MKSAVLITAVSLLAVATAAPVLGQTASLNPLGLDGDPLHAYNPPAPPPPTPDYVAPAHRRHHQHSKR